MKPGKAAPGPVVGFVILAFLILGVCYLGFRIYRRIKWSVQRRRSSKKEEQIKRTEHIFEALAKVVKVSLSDLQLHGFKPIAHPIDLEFSDLGLKLDDGKVALKNISGQFPSGNMAAVMGPSGCGFVFAPSFYSRSFY